MEQFKTFFHRQSVATKREIIPCKKERKARIKIVTFKTNIRRRTKIKITFKIQKKRDSNIKYNAASINVFTSIFHLSALLCSEIIIGSG